MNGKPSRLLKNAFRRHSERSEESLLQQNANKRAIPHFADFVRNDESGVFQQAPSGLLRGLGRRGSRSRGFRGVGQFAGGFDNLLGQVIRDMGFVPANGEIRGAQQLLLAIAQGVANGLLNLRIINAAQPRGLACNELQDASAVL